MRARGAADRRTGEDRQRRQSEFHIVPPPGEPAD